MSLKTDIERIFADNTNYTNPSQAVNQASSLNALSGDLYTDSKRFIYELLQNADDSSQSNEVIKVWIKTFDDYLVVAHSGRVFDERDLQGICNVNNGTKKSDPKKTGYKGIGFKSVFGQSERVIIFTNGECFRFDSSYPFNWNWEESKAQWEQRNDRKFQFPWQIIPIFTEVTEISESINQYLQHINANVATIIQLNNLKETRQAVQSLSQDLNMFLFLKNISRINFDVSTSISVEIERTKQNRITLKQNETLKTCWLINTVSLTVPNDLKASLQEDRNIPKKLRSADSIELSLATKIGNDGITKLAAQESLLYSYLPTGETKYSLPVLINTSFLITANRESLHTDSTWNQWLFKNIAIEIFKWISELVNSEFQYQAYRLIPKETRIDELGIEFNKGIKEALDTIPFIASNENELIKVKDDIVDFTFLSEKDFVGEIPIKNFIDKEGGRSAKKFAENTGFGVDFKRLGATSFEWINLNSFLSSKSFLNTFTLAKNIKFIKHLKSLCDSEKVKDVSIETLRKLPFIWDHKNHINYPTNVCFPATGDQNWNNSQSDLSFLHPELQDWLSAELEIRTWLENLGLTEKTDITYITQTILPQIDSYVNDENAIQVLRDLFVLYRKGNLKEDLIKRLSKIKLLTQQGSLCSAEECFLSNFYSPRLEIEKVLENDIFVNTKYCEDTSDKDEWKRFFKMLGVQEGISILSYPDKCSKTELINAGYSSEFFETKDKKFKPRQSIFSADDFKNIITLSYVFFTENNPTFALKFWQDFIENNSPESINISAIAFWGYSGRAGQISGDPVGNFIPWYIKNFNCIPVINGKCEISSSVFLNTEEIKAIAGNYLPVFDGIALSPDWKAFFSFKTSLQLTDYLEILRKIASDVNQEGKVKRDNYNRIESIYYILLELCANWSETEILQVEEWANTGYLLNTKYQFTECIGLKYFVDGKNSIFQDQFYFLTITAKNKRHPNLECLLQHFRIKLLKISDFELINTHEEVCSSLISHLKVVIPYFKIWIENEANDERTGECLENLKDKISTLNIYQTEELKIKYADIDFVKSVNVHFNKTDLFVTSPWNSNSVLLKLPETLCRYFDLIGHDKKLDFLLRSNNDEIQEYFTQEEMNIPEKVLEEIDVANEETHNQNYNSFAEIENAITEGKISPNFFHLSTSEYKRLKYIERLITRAVDNIIEHLKKHPEYDCTYYYKIADSIIGGITKNGNEITVVARPSDNDEVLIYYTSEFDVLEYVDAEFWYEDGINTPKQITLGQLLKKTGINRIPIKNIDISDFDLDTLLNGNKSEVLDFNAVPFVPQKIAKIISSFANTNSGSLIFGLKETSPTTNEMVGLSTDFKVVEITKKAISLLEPIPTVTYGWVKSGEKSIFIIKTDKSENDILLDNSKYIRQETRTVEETSISTVAKTLAVSQFNRTIAIIIGIEDYASKDEHQISPVKYADADALKFKKMLIECMSVDEKDIFIFLNEHALKSSLEYDLFGLFHSLSKEDRLIFYYVGHGFHNGITNYLSTYDMHKHHIVETAVSLRKVLLDPLRKSKCKNALIFIDACAQSFQVENERSLITDINDEELILLTNEFPYYATFLSCNTGQKSYSSDILKNGIWTHHLVKAIRGDVPEVIKGNRYVTDTLLKNYLSTSVAQYTKKELGYDQHPKAILDSSNENVIVEVGLENVE